MATIIKVVHQHAYHRHEHQQAEQHHRFDWISPSIHGCRDMSILIHAFSASIMVCTNTVLSLSQVTRFSSFSTNKQASKQMRERRKECAATRQ